MSTWVIGDIHGCLDEMLCMFDKIEKIDNKAKFILVGDLIDRGPKVKEILDWAINNIKPNGKYQTVIGNHEYDVLYSYNKLSRDCFDKTVNTIFYNNYGFQNQFPGLKISEIAKYFEMFKRFPYYLKIEENGNKYVIAHAWFGEGMCEEDIVWKRDVHKYTLLRLEFVSEDNEVLIHGHTPTLSSLYEWIEHEPGKIIDFGDNINIDCGLVFKVTADERSSHYERMIKGNLAAYNLSTKEVVYLF